jgi:hypothetical protein
MISINKLRRSGTAYKNRIEALVGVRCGVNPDAGTHLKKSTSITMAMCLSSVVCDPFHRAANTAVGGLSS